jgi:hypothetical protein
LAVTIVASAWSPAAEEVVTVAASAVMVPAVNLVSPLLAIARFATGAAAPRSAAVLASVERPFGSAMVVPVLALTAVMGSAALTL